MLKWENWLYGLASGFIGGGAGAIGSWTGLAAAKSVGLDVHTLNWKEFGIVMLSGGIVSAASFLKQSPLPARATGNTEIFVKPNVTP